MMVPDSTLDTTHNDRALTPEEQLVAYLAQLQAERVDALKKVEGLQLELSSVSQQNVELVSAAELSATQYRDRAREVAALTEQLRELREENAFYEGHLCEQPSAWPIQCDGSPHEQVKAPREGQKVVATLVALCEALPDSRKDAKPPVTVIDAVTVLRRRISLAVIQLKEQQDAVREANKENEEMLAAVEKVDADMRKEAQRRDEIIERLRAELIEAHHDNEVLFQTVDVLQKEKAGKQADHTSERSVASKSQPHREDELSQLREDLSKAAANVTELMETVDSRDTQIKELQAEVVASRTAKEAARASLERRETQLRQMQQRLETVSGSSDRLQHLRSALESRDRAISRLKEKLAQSQAMLLKTQREFRQAVAEGTGVAPGPVPSTGPVSISGLFESLFKPKEELDDPTNEGLSVEDLGLRLRHTAVKSLRAYRSYSYGILALGGSGPTPPAPLDFKKNKGTPRPLTPTHVDLRASLGLPATSTPRPSPPAPPALSSAPTTPSRPQRRPSTSAPKRRASLFTTLPRTPDRPPQESTRPASARGSADSFSRDAAPAPRTTSASPGPRAEQELKSLPWLQQRGSVSVSGSDTPVTEFRRPARRVSLRMASVANDRLSSRRSSGGSEQSLP